MADDDVDQPEPPSAKAISVDVDCGRRDSYLADCASVMRRAAAAPGCRDFLVYPDPLYPDLIRVFERWDAEQELLSFRGSGPDTEQNDRILDAEVDRYRISTVEPA